MTTYNLSYRVNGNKTEETSTKRSAVIAKAKKLASDPGAEFVELTTGGNNTRMFLLSFGQVIDKTGK